MTKATGAMAERIQNWSIRFEFQVPVDFGRPAWLYEHQTWNPDSDTPYHSVLFDCFRGYRAGLLFYPLQANRRDPNPAKVKELETPAGKIKIQGAYEKGHRGHRYPRYHLIIEKASVRKREELVVIHIETTMHRDVEEHRLDRREQAVLDCLEWAGRFETLFPITIPESAG